MRVLNLIVETRLTCVYREDSSVKLLHDLGITDSPDGGEGWESFEMGTQVGGKSLGEIMKSLNTLLKLLKDVGG